MGDEFDLAVAMSEQQRARTDAMKSLISSVKATVRAQHERDAALAIVAAVRTACRDAQDAGQASVPLDALTALEGLTGGTP